MEVTPLSFGKWGLRHRKHRRSGGFGSEEPHWARLRAVKQTRPERQGPSVVAFKASLVQAVVFPVVMYGWESWTVKKAEH